MSNIHKKYIPCVSSLCSNPARPGSECQVKLILSRLGQAQGDLAGCHCSLIHDVTMQCRHYTGRDYRRNDPIH